MKIISNSFIRNYLIIIFGFGHNFLSKCHFGRRWNRWPTLGNTSRTFPEISWHARLGEMHRSNRSNHWNGANFQEIGRRRSTVQHHQLWRGSPSISIWAILGGYPSRRSSRPSGWRVWPHRAREWETAIGAPHLWPSWSRAVFGPAPATTLQQWPQWRDQWWSTNECSASPGGSGRRCLWWTYRFQIGRRQCQNDQSATKSCEFVQSDTKTCEKVRKTGDRLDMWSIECRAEWGQWTSLPPVEGWGSRSPDSTEKWQTRSNVTKYSQSRCGAESNWLGMMCKIVSVCSHWLCQPPSCNLEHPGFWATCSTACESPRIWRTKTSRWNLFRHWMTLCW